MPDSPTMPSDPNDKAYRDVVGEERPWLELPTAAELAGEASLDPTHPQNDATAMRSRTGKGGHLLSDSQQLQIALWLVEGFAWREAKGFMLDRWGFAISEPTWRYYKTVRRDLLDVATGILEDQTARFGAALRPIRLKKLIDHLAHLEDYQRQNGLFEAEVHTVAVGHGKTEQVTSKKFAAALSKEIRETLKDIRQMQEPIEQSQAAAKQRSHVSVAPEATDRFLLAAGWDPQTVVEEAKP